MSAPSPGVSVVVPVHNSGPLLNELVGRVRAALSGTEGGIEILLVNDASADDSWAVIEGICRATPGIVGLDLARKLGQQNALVTGVLRARGRVIVTLDDDLEQPPEEIPKLLARLAEGYDVVFGIPRGRQRPWGRRLATAGVRFVIDALTPYRVTGAPMRAFRAGLRDGFPRAPTPFASLDVLLTWAMGPIATVDVACSPSRRRRSGQRWGAMLDLFGTGVTGITLRPLRWAWIAGAGLVGAGAAGFLWAGARAWRDGATPLALLIVSAVAFFSGLQGVWLGILGEYVGRLHFLAMGIPAGVVRREAGSGAPRELKLTERAKSAEG